MIFPNSIRITLRQHTPLIHFQHEQPDATLRATEIKPRLDKFIIDQSLKPIPSHWYIGKEENKHPALEYKLQIIASTQPVSERIATLQSRSDPSTKIASYFGNSMGLTWPPKSLTLIFTSFETEVLDAIYQHIVPFFVLNNFGQRQTKGLGSFTVDQVNGIPVPSYSGRGPFGVNDMESILNQRYPVFYKYNNNTYTPLKTIHEEYQLLKAGRSAESREGYHKSKLFDFFIEKQPRVRWEKRKIKQEINSYIGQNGCFTYPLFKKRNLTYYKTKDSEDQNNYVRALLGLAETNEYLVDDNSTDKNGFPKGSGTIKYVVVIDHKSTSDSKKIERLASPILFKVFNNEVYLLPQEIDERILDKSFTFTLQAKKLINGQWTVVSDDGKPAGKLLDTLMTPSSFDLLDFLNEALDKNSWQLLP